MQLIVFIFLTCLAPSGLHLQFRRINTVPLKPIKFKNPANLQRSSGSKQRPVPFKTNLQLNNSKKHDGVSVMEASLHPPALLSSRVFCFFGVFFLFGSSRLILFPLIKPCFECRGVKGGVVSREAAPSHQSTLSCFCKCLFFPPPFLIEVYFGDESRSPGRPTSLAPVSVRACCHVRGRLRRGGGDACRESCL